MGDVPSFPLQMVQQVFHECDCQALPFMSQLLSMIPDTEVCAQRTGQYYRLIPTTAATHEQDNPVQLPSWQKTNSRHARQSHPGQTIALEDSSSNLDDSAWSTDPVRSTCCLQ